MVRMPTFDEKIKDCFPNGFDDFIEKEYKKIFELSIKHLKQGSVEENIQVLITLMDTLLQPDLTNSQFMTIHYASLGYLVVLKQYMKGLSNANKTTAK